MPADRRQAGHLQRQFQHEGREPVRGRRAQYHRRWTAREARCMNLLRKLRHDQRGAAVIELAIAAPVLAMLVIGMSDITIAYGRELDLEQGAQRAIEKVMQTTGDQTV